MNHPYIKNINKKTNCMKRFKIFSANMWQSIKKPFVRTRVIQIGVGGSPSCGKTVLIDAMFGVLDNQYYPKYLDSEFISSRTLHTKTDIFDGKYFRYTKIRDEVGAKFHIGEETTDNGTWNSHTYWAELRLKGMFWKKVLLIIRNLPGEMFAAYYTMHKINNQDISLNHIFENYFIGNEEYKRKHKYYKDYFKHPVQETKIKEMKQDFYNYLSRYEGLSDTITTNWITDEIGDEKTRKITDSNDGYWGKNFYAYLFYKTSESLIHCVRSVEPEDSDINRNIEINRCMDNIPERLLCITQFDRILDDKNSVVKFNREVYYKKYVSIMLDIYNDIENNTFEKVNKDKWQLLRLTDNYHLVSVAFNYTHGVFFNFTNDKSSQNGNEGADNWIIGNSHQRISLGVVELVSSVLDKSNIKLTNLNSFTEGSSGTYENYLKRLTYHKQNTNR